MALWKNISGITVSVPVVGSGIDGGEDVPDGQDVLDQEVVEVPDDVVMSPEYFVRV